MTSVDSRIVTMKFDNAKFEQNVQTTMNSMGRLKRSLDFSGVKSGIGALMTPFNKLSGLNPFAKGKQGVDDLTRSSGIFSRLNPFSNAQRGVDNLQGSTSKFSLAGMEGGITHISGKFTALATVGITALATITSKAVTAGLQFAKSFAVQPILDGLHEYETNLQSIQTIQANTDQPLPKINHALSELNKYSDQTIYNFSEMAKNIGTFTAAGVDLKTATSSIKGIANLAALSGSNSEQASTAMYQLSQAISSGKVGLQDWNSVVNAGMGGKKLQNALAQTAVGMGVLKGGAVGLSGKMKQLTINGGSFRESIQAKPGEKPWLTSQVLVNTLAALDGRFSMSALLAQKNADGTQKYTKAQAAAAIATARTAMETKNGVKYTDKQFASLKQLSTSSFLAATQVKTLGQVFDVAKETIGSGWGASFQNIFGNFGQAKKSFTDLSNYVNGIINKGSMARNKVLSDWNKGGGRSAAIDAIKNAFKALLSVFKPIHKAFREIFPAKTGKDLIKITFAIREFTKHLALGGAKSKALHDIFKGLFSILSIGIMIFKGVVHYFTSLIGLLAGGSGGILDLVAAVANIITKFRDWLAQGDKIGKMFDTVINGRAALLKPIIAFVSNLVSALAGLLTTGAEHAFDWMASLAPYVTSVMALIAQFKAFAGTKVAEYLAIVAGYVKQFQAYVAESTPKVIAWVKSFAPLGASLRNVVGLFQRLASSGAQGFIEAMKTGFENVGPLISGLGSKIKAGITNMLTAIGNFDLGSIFSGGKSTTTAAAGIDVVNASLKAVKGTGDQVKGAWQGVINAFQGVGTFLKPVYEGIKNIFSNLGDKLKHFVSGMGLDDGLALVNTGFFIALYMMIRSFVKNLRGVVSSLTETLDSLGGVFDQTTKNLKTMQHDVKANIILKIAAALLLLAIALLILSKIPLKQLGFALGAVGTLLLMVVVALKSLSKTFDSFSSAASMAALAAAMVGIGLAVLALAAAVGILGRMKAKTLIKGIAAVGAILLIITGVTKVMDKTGGAAQLAIAAVGMVLLAAALLVFAAAIKVFALIKTETLLNGGLKIAAALTAIALIMSLMPPNILVSAAAILVMSGALVILAAALTLIGNIGIKTLAVAIGTLAIVLPILGIAMELMTGTLLGSAAMIVMSAALVLLAVALGALGSLSLKTIGIALLAIAGAFTVLGLAALILTPVVPIILALAYAIGLLGLAALAVGAGLLLFATGLALLAASGAAGIAVLTAAIISIAELFPLIMRQIGLGIQAFAIVISKSGPQLVKALTTVLLSLCDAVIKATPRLADTLVTLIKNGLRVIRETFPDFVKTGYAIIIALANGAKNNIGKIVTVVADIIVNFLNALSKALPRIVNAGFNFIISLMNGITNAINTHSEAMGRAGGNLAVAIVNGMVKGIGAGAGAIADAAVNAAKGALNGAMHFLHIQSPSKVFRDQVGKQISAGMALGIDQFAPKVTASAKNAASGALNGVKSTLSGIPKAIEGHLDASPVITPVLDLSKIAKGAPEIKSMIDKQSIANASKLIRPNTSMLAANTIASGTPTHQLYDLQSGSSTVVKPTAPITFVQNNNSPKTLGAVDIYRNTKNQLSMAKGALTR